ncbi:hypothetical protein EHM76_00335 [bacterium]|nr:MAG: hypothetical protein EHM76_00335 [bacterium]
MTKMTMPYYVTSWHNEAESRAGPVQGGVAWIRETIEEMTPAQFDAYEAGIRAQPYEAFAQNQDLITALQEVNRRRQSEGLDITVRSGNQASLFGGSIPTWVWVAGGVALLVLIGRR